MRDDAAAMAAAMAAEVWAALDGPGEALGRLDVIGSESLPSAFPVTDLAVASIGAAALAVADLVGGAPRVSVDRRRASLWFGLSLRPDGWQMPPPWDAIAGDYQTADGWIKLHTNAPHHRAAALRVLGCAEDRAAVAAVVAGWTADALEAAVVAAGGCAAAMRDLAAWRQHPQGQHVAQETLIAVTSEAAAEERWQPGRERPLAGLRVLDLTRVLAGPVATRELAGRGADVLRIDPPAWDEPAVVPEVTPGKRCARLDLTAAADRAIFERLLAQADLLVHGYRPGALDRLGYDPATRRRLRPGLLEVQIDAYGWTGPWAGRRGFDSLVQMSSGIAAEGMRWRGAAKPVPLPVQALDLATGYLAAAAAIRAVAARTRDGVARSARLSLARTAHLLCSAPRHAADAAFETSTGADMAEAVEATAWGPARRVAAPATIDGIPLRWDRGAVALGSSAAEWLTR